MNRLIDKLYRKRWFLWSRLIATMVMGICFVLNLVVITIALVLVFVFPDVVEPLMIVMRIMVPILIAAFGYTIITTPRNQEHQMIVRMFDRERRPPTRSRPY